MFQATYNYKRDLRNNKQIGKIIDCSLFIYTGSRRIEDKSEFKIGYQHYAKQQKYYCKCELRNEKVFVINTMLTNFRNQVESKN
jgi:hypothetical protein